MRFSLFSRSIAAVALVMGLSVAASATERHLQDLRSYCELECQDTPNTVPEPGALGLLGLGLAGMYLAGRRRKP